MPIHAAIPANPTGKILRDDGSWVTTSGGPGAATTQTTVDFGAAAIAGASFVVVDVAVSQSSKIIVQQYDTSDVDENTGDMDPLTFSVRAGSGSFKVYAESRTPVRGTFKIQYLVT